MAETKKQQAGEYDTKPAIVGSFENIGKVSVSGNPAPKPVKPPIRSK